jgi:hypothetical protein
MTAGEGAAVGALVAGGAVAGAVALLLQNVVRPAIEIKRYADDIQASIDAIARNVEGVSEVVATRDLAVAVPPLATAYLERLGKAPS